MKILVTGANGMLGQDFCPVFEKAGYEVIKAARQNFDITDYNTAHNFITAQKPDIIANLAAYTNVDEAETQKETADLTNHIGACNLAKIAEEIGAVFIQISTDYVFDGTKNSPYLTADKVNPVNVYGKTKLLGEIAVAQNAKKHYIVRTSWLYGQFGKNFVSTMLRLAKTNKTINVVDDQTGCPTYTKDLSEGILNLVQNRLPFGIHHISGEGETTWYGFAKEIFALKNLDVNCLPTTSEKYITPAKRPKYSVLQNTVKLRHWKDALKDYLKL